MNTQTFIQGIRATTLIPNTIRDVLMEHAEDLTDEERMSVMQALAKAEQANARSFAEAAAALQQPVRVMTKVTRESEEEADRAEEQKNLPSL